MRDPLQDIADEIRSAGGVAEFAALDATDARAVAVHAAGVYDRDGRIDISLNAVGFPHVQGVPFAELTVDQFVDPVFATRA